MSQLSDLTNGPRPDLVPGLTLRRLNLAAIGVVEDCIQRWYVDRTAAATARLDAASQRQVVNRAAEDAAFALVYGTGAFLRATRSADGIGATLLASAAMTDPHADPDAVRAKVNAVDPAVARIASEWCWGREPAAGTGGADPLAATPPAGGGGASAATAAA